MAGNAVKRTIRTKTLNMAKPGEQANMSIQNPFLLIKRSPRRWWLYSDLRVRRRTSRATPICASRRVTTRPASSTSRRGKRNFLSVVGLHLLQFSRNVAVEECPDRIDTAKGCITEE